jgi:hypothetical protein
MGVTPLKIDFYTTSAAQFYKSVTPQTHPEQGNAYQICIFSIGKEKRRAKP